MKILLLNPPRFNMIKISSDWFVDLGEISSFPPIGLMYIAGYLRKHSNYKISLVDSIAEGMSYSDIEILFKKEQPDVLGITAFTFTFYDVLKTIKLAKMVNPKIIVVLGGPHISMFWQETLSHKEVDYIIEGDGEISFLKLLNSLENKDALLKIPGLIYKQKNTIIKNEPETITNLDALQFPAFDLLNLSKYYSTLGTQKNVGTICTSRGCPFRCSYCQVRDKKYRYRTSGNIAEELQLYIKKGIDDFFFFDDMFNITADRVLSICNEILKQKLKITWSFRGRVDQVNEEMFKLAKAAGCRLVLFGIEDYTNENLKKINKNITIEQSITAIKLAKKYKILTSTNWIIGFPHHKSEQDIYKLLKTAKKINSDYAQFSILQLMPHSKMYNDCIEEKTLNKNTWSDFAKNPTPDFYIELYEKYLTRKKLVELYKMCYKKYYIRFFYIVKNIFKTNSWTEFMVKSKVFFKIFFQKREKDVIPAKAGIQKNSKKLDS